MIESILLWLAAPSAEERIAARELQLRVSNTAIVLLQAERDLPKAQEALRQRIAELGRKYGCVIDEQSLRCAAGK